jgi:hypothetical protein
VAGAEVVTVELFRDLERTAETVPPLVHCYLRELPSWEPGPVALCGHRHAGPHSGSDLPQGSETCVVCAEIAQRAGI